VAYNRAFRGGSILKPLIRSAAKVSSNTLLSRVFGFVRDLVVARVFGADEATDAFFVAFRIPNLLRRLFAEGAFALAFVPLLSEYREKRPFEDLKTFVDQVAGTLALVLLGVSLIAVVAAPLLILVFAPGWFLTDSGDAALAADLLRLTFPYLLFISLTAFAGGILNVHQKFGVPAFTPVLLNLSLIACALWLAPRLETPIIALGWGVLVAGIAQFAFQLPFLHQLHLLPRFRPAPRDEGVRRVIRLMGPALFGASVTQLGLVINTVFASMLREGSISWLYYADRLLEFPVGILGVALGTVVLPDLARLHARGDQAAFAATLDWGLRWMLLFGLPAAVGLCLLAGPLVATLFQSGVFDPDDVAMAQSALWAYSLGLVAFLSIKVLAPGFFARQDSRTPVLIGIKAVTTGLAINVVVVVLAFTVPALHPHAHAGLALATTVSAATNAALLYRALQARGIYTPSAGWRGLILKSVLASALMGGVLIWMSGGLSEWTAAGQMARLARLAGCIGAGAATYFAALWLLGVRSRHFQNPVTAAGG